MNADRWQQIKRVLDAATDAPEDRRDAIIAEACGGDATLAAAVRSLLAAPDDFMHEPLAGVAAGELFDGSPDGAGHPIDVDVSDDEDLATGTRIGAYEIERLLGRGGMGGVYLARRADGEFSQQVAIKIIQFGLRTSELLRRFKAERQILATLNHPNITRLIDGGTAPDGRPYLVMEYVDGVPIDRYCDAHQPSMAVRLRLFRQVCDAVQYAHRRLVVHRDLKPGNILVTADGTPKLLDFGIAKLLASDLIEPAPTAATVARPMTPAYATPEQVRGEPVTTATDVYALGVVLYELLTGARPYKATHRTTPALLNAICHEEPPRPSGVARPEWQRGLAGDIDTIVLTALRKEPERRYGSVEQLSGDLQRYLDGLPISARKDALAYRARKFVRRNRVAVAAAAVVIVSILAGAALAAWQAAVATRERARAERRFDDVRRLANSLMFDIHDEMDKGVVQARELLITRAATYLDSLAAEGDSDVDLQHELAFGYERLAGLQGSFLRLGQRGDAAAAEANYAKAAALRARIVEAAPAHFENRREMAAQRFNRHALPSIQAGRVDDGIKILRELLETVTVLLRERPDDSLAREFLPVIHYELSLAYGSVGVAGAGNRTASRTHLDEAVRLGEELLQQPGGRPWIRRGNLAAAYDSLAAWFQGEGRLAEARAIADKAIALSEALAREFPASAQMRRNLAAEYGNVASLLVAAADYPAALGYAQRALPLYEAVAAEDPASMQAKRDVAHGSRTLGRALALNNRHAEAMPYYTRAHGIYARLASAEPSDAYVARQLAFTHMVLAESAQQIDGPRVAVTEVQKGIAILERLVATQPRNATAWRTLAQSLEKAGSFSRGAAERGDRPRWQDARDFYARSRDAWRSMEKAAGSLAPPDAKQLAAAEAALAECDAALRRGVAAASGQH